MSKNKSALIAMVATAVMVDGKRTIIQPGQELPQLPEHDERELLESGSAMDPAVAAATDQARKQEEQFAQQAFQDARERAMAAHSSITSDAAKKAAADKAAADAAAKAAADKAAADAAAKEAADKVAADAAAKEAADKAAADAAAKEAADKVAADAAAKEAADKDAASTNKAATAKSGGK